MPVIHTPQKQTEDSGPLLPWQVTIGGQPEVVHVNEDQHKYLKLPSTTPEQQTQFLQRIFEDQQSRQEAAATAAATTDSEDLNPSRTSPTPTEKSLEEIERTKAKEESLIKNTEVKKLQDEAQDAGDDSHDGAACRDRHHEFEQRTKTHLAAAAKRFIKSVNTLMVQLDRTKWADEVSMQYGDELLQEVQALYTLLEEAREYCLEPLDQMERLDEKYTAYMEQKFELKCTCERIHRKYFEQQEENKLLRWQQQQQVQQSRPQDQGPAQIPIPTIVTTTPLPPPVFAPTIPAMMSSTPFQPPPIPHPGTNFVPIFGQHQGQHLGQPSTNPPPGFNAYNDQDSRVPTPSAPSVINEHHHTRFKLKEELSLVEPWDGSRPRAYMAFRAQWANFYEKMKQEDRSNLDLYYALLKVLGGSAKELAQTKYPNNTSYDQAIKKLDSLFYNPTNLLRDMVHNLLKGQKMVDTYESLLSGMTKLNDAWHDLDQADLTKNQLKGLLFVAATEKNLSEESWKCWLEVQNDPKFKQNPMDAFEISAYLGSINKAMLNAQKRKNAIGSRDSNPNIPPKTGKPGSGGRKQSTLFGSYSNAMANQGQGGSGNNQSKTKVQQQARGSNNTCVICGNNPHKYQLNCPKLREMTPNQIYKIMTDSGIECQMCLGLGHRTRECPAVQEGFLKKCSVKEDNAECGRYHCRFLHKFKRANEESKETAQPKSKQE